MFHLDIHDRSGNLVTIRSVGDKIFVFEDGSVMFSKPGDNKFKVKDPTRDDFTFTFSTDKLEKRMEDISWEISLSQKYLRLEHDTLITFVDIPSQKVVFTADKYEFFENGLPSLSEDDAFLTWYTYGGDRQLKIAKVRTDGENFHIFDPMYFDIGKDFFGDHPQFSNAATQQLILKLNDHDEK